ncbi:MAG: hypothetical protein ACRDP4_14050, partial [Nocardioidaceae bacterium]
MLLWETSGAGADSSDSVSGCGLSWTRVDAATGYNARGSLWIGTGNATSGAVSWTYAAAPGGGVGWRIMQVTGTSGIVQSASLDKGYNGKYYCGVSLANPPATGSVTVGNVSYNSVKAITVGDGYTQLGTQQRLPGSPAVVSMSETGASQEVYVTLGTKGAAGLVGVELGEAVTPPTSITPADLSVSVTTTRPEVTAPAIPPTSVVPDNSVLSVAATRPDVTAPYIPPTTITPANLTVATTSTRPTVTAPTLSAPTITPADLGVATITTRPAVTHA